LFLLVGSLVLTFGFTLCVGVGIPMSPQCLD
jgi:hypothetical protein